MQHKELCDTHQIKHTFPHYAIDNDHVGFSFDAETEKHFDFRPKIERMTPEKKVSSKDKHQIGTFNKKHMEMSDKNKAIDQIEM